MSVCLSVFLSLLSLAVGVLVNVIHDSPRNTMFCFSSSEFLNSATLTVKLATVFTFDDITSDDVA